MGLELFMESGVSLTRLFQENFFNLHSVMQILNFISEPESAFLLFFAIYWGINRDLGSRYLYVLGLFIVVFSILQQIIQLPAPFWLDESILLEETGSFAAPNLNVAVIILMVIPFMHRIRADLVVLVFVVAIGLIGSSQVYLAVATIFDVALGLLLAGLMCAICYVWQRRFGRTFANRILGQRFWAAIIIPILLGLGYLFLISWVRSTGYTGVVDVDPQLHHRAWLTGFLNVFTGLAILLGLGTGIALESSRIGFRPSGQIGNALINWIIGFTIMAAVTYALTNWISASAIYESGTLIDFGLVATAFFAISIISVYLIPWTFTLIGSTPAEVQDLPEISLNRSI